MPPTSAPSFEAALSSIATSFAPTGHLPCRSFRGLKRWSVLETLNASPGAPWRASTFPSLPTNCAMSPIPPAASSTAGSAFTLARVASGNDGAFCEPPNSSLPVMMASEVE